MYFTGDKCSPTLKNEQLYLGITFQYQIDILLLTHNLIDQKMTNYLKRSYSCILTAICKSLSLNKPFIQEIIFEMKRTYFL